MDLSKLKNKYVEIVNSINQKGIPFPMARDPKTGVGSVSLTLVIFSSALVMIGLVGKWSGKLGGIDMSNALQFFYASSGLYFMRTWTSKDGTAVGDAAKKDPSDQSTPS